MAATALPDQPASPKAAFHSASDPALRPASDFARGAASSPAYSRAPVAATIAPARLAGKSVDRDVAVLSRALGLGRHADLGKDAGNAVLRIAAPARPDAPAANHMKIPAAGLADAGTADRDGIDWSGAGTLVCAVGPVQVQDLPRFLRVVSGIDIAACAGASSAHRDYFFAAAAGRLARTPWGAVRQIRAAAITTDATDATDATGATNAPDSTGAADAIDTIDAAGAVTVRLTIDDGDHAVSMLARAAAGTWIGLLETSPWQRSRLAMHRFRHLGVGRAIRLASHTLPGAAARALRQGDIILPDQPRFTAEGAGSIQLGRLRLDVRFFEPASLEVLGLRETNSEDKDDGMTDSWNDEDSDILEAGNRAATGLAGEAGAASVYSAAAAPTTDGGAPRGSGHEDRSPALDDRPHPDDAGDAELAHDPLLDQMPVTLHFDLGRLDMPLADLRTLGVGVILPLENASPRAIAIVAGGRRLGTGEAVEVDGQLAIRVTSWSAAR